MSWIKIVVSGNHFVTIETSFQGILLISFSLVSDFWNLVNFGCTSCYIIARGGLKLVSFRLDSDFSILLSSVLRHKGLNANAYISYSWNTCRIPNAYQQHKSNCVIAHWELWGHTLLSLLVVTHDFAYQSSIGYSPCRIKLDLCVLTLRTLSIWRMYKNHY